MDLMGNLLTTNVNISNGYSFQERLGEMKLVSMRSLTCMRFDNMAIKFISQKIS